MRPASLISWLKRDPWLALLLGMLGLCSLAEIGYGLQRRRAAQRTEARWAKKRQEWDLLCRVTPPATRATAAAIEARLEKVRQTLSGLEENFGSRAPGQKGLPEAGPPMKSTDAFFELAEFAEKIRDRAARNGVKTKPDERFGFSAYAQHGPETELIPMVLRQKMVMQCLAEALITARPEQLIGFEREQPVASSDGRRRESAPGGKRRPAQPLSAGPALFDLFEIDPRISARVPQRVSTLAFRLTFVGQTATLRAFLNAVSRAELPLLVRALEVEPVAPAGGKSPPDRGQLAPAGLVLAAGSAPGPIPLVPRLLSKFVVTVEYAEWTAADAAPTPAT